MNLMNHSPGEQDRQVEPVAVEGDHHTGVIDRRLEDPCGNRVGEPFEVDVRTPPERSPPTEPAARAFEVR